jgi:Rieske Fe-S protein
MSEPTRPAESTTDAGTGADTAPCSCCAAAQAAPRDSVPSVHPLERRSVLRVAGVAGVAGMVGVGLAACSSSNNSTAAGGGSTSGSSAAASDTSGAGSGSSATASASSGGSGSGSGTALGAASQVPVGGGFIFADQKVVVTQPTAGTYKAFSSTCTHMGCQVNQVSGGTIDCPCHGSKYSITDGSVQGGPAPQPLPAEKVTVQGGQLFLNG